MWIIALIILILLLAVAVVSYPLIIQQLEPYALPEQSDQSFSERDALLEAMSDLEQSLLGGKVSRADYDTQRNRLQQRYIEVVQQPGA